MRKEGVKNLKAFMLSQVQIITEDEVSRVASPLYGYKNYILWISSNSLEHAANILNVS